VEVLQACAGLHTVGFLSSEGIGDLHLFAVMLRRPQITALQIVFTEWERTITDAGLEQLFAQCRQIEDLRLCSLYCLSDAVLHSITRQCSRLESLSLPGLEGLLSEQALVVLFATLRRLDDLDVQDVTWLSDAVLQAIAVHCQHLRVLDVIDASGFSEKGLAAIVNDSTALRSLYISKDHLVLNKMARLIWKALRPQVEFYHDKWCTNPWNDFRAEA
jgi:hypothetical protein